MRLITSFLVAVLFSFLIFPMQVFAAKDAFLGDEYPNVCLGVAIEREEIGGTRFPIAPKYKHLNWLGQLFTADDCGEARLKEFYDGEDAAYELGSTISLKNKPSQQFRRLLKSIGYSCNKKMDEKSCTNWGVLNEDTVIYKFLLLKSYKNKIKGDDCVNCG